MTRAEFDQTIARQHGALVRFAAYLGANRLFPGIKADAARDLVHDTVERLTRTSAYERYAFEPGATRIPAWLRRAIEYTVLAERAKLRRRNDLVREDLEERVNTGEVGISLDDEGDLDLIGPWPANPAVAAEAEERHFALVSWR